MGAERIKEARLQTLMAEFDPLKMKDSETIDDFAGKLSEISSKSAALGIDIEEPKLVRKFLKSLPHKKYIQIVAFPKGLVLIRVGLREEHNLLGILACYFIWLIFAEPVDHLIPLFRYLRDR